MALRDSRDQAVRDAIAAGEAERDEHDDKRLWWKIMAEIEAEQV